MMRLPRFRYYGPLTIADAVQRLAAEGPDAVLLAGGTDLLPKLKRRQQIPRTVIGLQQIPDLRSWFDDPAGTLSLGACLKISEIVRRTDIRERFPALWSAASQVATPQIRNMASLGGNLCLETRCRYYDQTDDWRRTIGSCKRDGADLCQAVPGSARCLAVSSTDLAPALYVLDARIRLVSCDGEREIPIADLYRNDGSRHLTCRPDEILTEVRIGFREGWRSTYRKLRRRGSFDFPVLSVAAAARFGAGAVIEETRLVIGAVASSPLEARAAEEFLVGRTLNTQTIQEASDLVTPLAKPLDNADFTATWRKKVTRQFVMDSLEELHSSYAATQT